MRDGEDRNWHALLPQVFDELRQTYQSDIESINDSRSFSVWLVAFATAPIAILIAKAPEFAKAVKNPMFGFVSIAVVFFLAAVLAGLIHSVANSYAATCRELMALVTLGRFAIIAGTFVAPAAVGIDAVRFIQQIMRGEYLPPDSKRTWDSLQRDRRSYEILVKVGLAVQKILLVFGYGELTFLLYRYVKTLPS